MSKALETLIPIQEIERSLATENPWWETGEIPARFRAYPRRAYYKMFMDLIQTKVNRAIVLLGPRRVGKTVLATHCIQGLIDNGIDPNRIFYVSIDAPTYTNIPLEQFVQMFLSRQGLPTSSPFYIVFDEIQYLPEWERHLKTLVDRMPDARFIASGSAAAALKMASTESGAGRFTEFMLPPLTFSEYLSFINREDELVTAPDPHENYFKSKNISELNKEFQNYINYGGYPEAVFSQDVRSDAARYIKNDVIEKVLLRDLPQLYGIQNIQELNKLFTALAYQTGQETSLEKLSSLSGITKPTISRYIEYLEAAFLLFRVKRIDQTARSFQRERTFKVHLTNPSMRAALFSPTGQNSEGFGHLVETAILAQFFHSDVTDLFYARWKRSGMRKSLGDHGEIDIVCCSPADFQPSWLVEVKWSDTAQDSEETWASIDEFSAKHNLLNSGVVTSRTRSGTMDRSGINFIICPSALYCYTVGRNTVEAVGERRMAIEEDEEANEAKTS